MRQAKIAVQKLVEKMNLKMQSNKFRIEQGIQGNTKGKDLR